MPCRHVQLPGGGHAILCGPRQKPKRCPCGSGEAADLLCDWKLPAGGTCDAELCVLCSTKPAADKDLCPTHAAAWKAWKAEKARLTPGPP